VPAVAGYPTVAVSNGNGTPSLEDDAADGIYSYRVGDSAPTQLVLADNVTGLLVDDEYIYYIRQNTLGVWRARITGSAGTQISDNGVARLVGQDDQFVYAISSSLLRHQRLQGHQVMRRPSSRAARQLGGDVFEQGACGTEADRAQGVDGGLREVAGTATNLVAGAGFDHGLADELNGLAIARVDALQRVL